VMPAHVHLFASFPPTLAIRQIMYRLKGSTSHQLRKEFPHLKSRLPSLWTRSYYVGTAGHVSAATIKRYIDEQKGQ
jgi:putative transposase